MMFKVKCQGNVGHPDEFSEVPWGNLKNNVYLHNYLRDNNMTSIIPKTFLKGLVSTVYNVYTFLFFFFETYMFNTFFL